MKNYRNVCLLGFYPGIYEKTWPVHLICSSKQAESESLLKVIIVKVPICALLENKINRAKLQTVSRKHAKLQTVSRKCAKLQTNHASLVKLQTNRANLGKLQINHGMLPKLHYIHSTFQPMRIQEFTNGQF